MYPRLGVAVMLLALVIAGCSKESSSPVDSTEPDGLVVTPSDGKTGVPLDAVVTLTFGRPVDRSVVERSFHLLTMADSLCPGNTTSGHGVMSGMMPGGCDLNAMGPETMHDFTGQQAIPGKFLWDTDDTQCTFKPDSMMTPATWYMIHMGREMMEMMRDRMGDMSRMGGHTTGTISDLMVYHFTTLDMTGGGCGNGGHH